MSSHPPMWVVREQNERLHGNFDISNTTWSQAKHQISSGRNLKENKPAGFFGEEWIGLGLGWREIIHQKESTILRFQDSIYFLTSWVKSVPRWLFWAFIRIRPWEWYCYPKPQFDGFWTLFWQLNDARASTNCEFFAFLCPGLPFLLCDA